MATTAILARAPFDDLSGDIILRSGGDKAIDFYTHKFFLVHASPVFKDMFSLPQPSDGQAGGASCPVVHLSDSPDDVRALLHVCMPKTDNK